MGIKTATENDKYRQFGSRKDVYSDFGMSFLPNPNTGQIPRKINVEAVKQSLRSLLLTNKYERLRNPNYGTRIRNYLFENYDGHIEDEIRDEIYQAVRNYEPRIRLIEVTVQAQPDDNAIVIDIEFAVVTSNESANLELVLYRVR